MNALDYIKGKINIEPELGIILGSGLGDFAKNIEDPIHIPFSEVPGFAASTVQGHAGEFIFGQLFGKKIVAMNGRVHYYEGHPISQVVLPVKVMTDLGIKNLIVTNAAGGVNKEFNPGDLMIITDHINFTGVNPLIGPNEDNKGPRFLDMSETYSLDSIALAKKVAREEKMDLKEGVYMWFTGPCYETAAEVRLARTLGADAVGMSTVPEVIIAHHRGVKVLGISLITNHATGVSKEPLSHEDVVLASKKAEGRFKLLVEKIVQVI